MYVIFDNSSKGGSGLACGEHVVPLIEHFGMESATIKPATLKRKPSACYVCNGTVPREGVLVTPPGSRNFPDCGPECEPS